MRIFGVGSSRSIWVATGRRAFAFLVGLVLAFALAEFALSLANRRAQALPPVPSGGVSVLCVGGTHAAGLGVSPQETYCAQLAMLAADAASAVHFLPLGRAGWNTSQIHDELPAWLERYRPKVVLLLAGEENYLNLEGYETCPGVSLRCKPLLYRRIISGVLGLRTVRFVRSFASHLGWGFGGRSQYASDLKVLEGLLNNQPVADRRAARAAAQRLYERAGGEGVRAAAAARMIARLVAEEPASHREQLRWLELSFLAMPSSLYSYRLERDFEDFRLRDGFPLGLEAKRRHLVGRLGSRWPAAPPYPELRGLFRRPDQLGRDLDPVALAQLKACHRDKNCRYDLRRILLSRPEDISLRRTILDVVRAEGDYRLAVDLLADWLDWNPVEADEAPLTYLIWLRRALRDPALSAEAGILDQVTQKIYRELPAWRLRVESCWSRERVDSWIAADLDRLRQVANERGAHLLVQTAPPQNSLGWPRRPVDYPTLEWLRTRPNDGIDTSLELASARPTELFLGNLLSPVGHRMLAEKVWRILRSRSILMP